MSKTDRKFESSQALSDLMVYGTKTDEMSSAIAVLLAKALHPHLRVSLQGIPLENRTKFPLFDAISKLVFHFRGASASKFFDIAKAPPRAKYLYKENAEYHVLRVLWGYSIALRYADEPNRAAECKRKGKPDDFSELLKSYETAIYGLLDKHSEQVQRFIPTFYTEQADHAH